MKPFMPGRPTDESVMSRNAAVSFGITDLMPPYSLMSRVWRRSDIMPTRRRAPPVLTPCASIW